MAESVFYSMNNNNTSDSVDQDSKDIDNTLQWVKQIFSTGFGLLLVAVGSILLISASSVGLTYQPTGTACPTLQVSLLLLFCTVSFASGGTLLGKSLIQMEPKEIKKEYKLGQLYYQFVAIIIALIVLIASSVLGIIAGCSLYPISGKCASTATCCMQSSATALLAISGTVLTLVFGSFIALIIGLINVFVLHYHLAIKSGTAPTTTTNTGLLACCALRLWPVKEFGNKKFSITSFL